MVRRKRSAFTLVELLVVIAIIGMLMGLVVPAVNSAREKARTGICLSNMRQVGLAVQSYESRSSGASYPGYKMLLRMTDNTYYKARASVGSAISPYPSSGVGATPGQGSYAAITWLVELFPYLDQQRLYDAWKTPVSTGSGVTNNIYTYIELVVCPSDPPSSTDRAPVSIAVNTGVRDGSTAGYRDIRANGVFQDLYTDHPNNPTPSQTKTLVNVSSAYIDRKGDGLQYTMLLSENVDAGSYCDNDERFLGITWAAPTQSVDTSTNPWSAVPPGSSGGSSSGGSGGGSSGGGSSSGSTASQATAGSGGGSSGGGSSGGTTSGGTTSITGFQMINQGKGAITSMIEDPAAGTGTYPDSTGSYYFCARPSSNHPNGVNVVFCDAHGLFLSDRIDYFVYCMLMTPDGANVKDPNTAPQLMPFSATGFGGGTQPAPPVFDEAWVRR